MTKIPSGSEDYRLGGSFALACAAALVLLAVLVKHGVFANLDAVLTYWLREHRTPWLSAIARGITFFGSSSWALSAGFVMSGWWLHARNRRLLLSFWAAWGAAFLGQVILRYWVGQLRPEAPIELAARDLATRMELSGFTSGHGFRSAFIFGWLAMAVIQERLPWARLLAIGCVAMIVLVGASRIYLMRHWLTDVLGAWLLAACALLAARFVAKEAKT